MRELHPPEGLAGEPEAVVRPCLFVFSFLEAWANSNAARLVGEQCAVPPRASVL